MCHYNEAKVIYKQCLKSPKHVCSKMRYYRCDKVSPIGLVCIDATATKGLNDNPIQFGSMGQTGKCPKCLS